MNTIFRRLMHVLRRSRYDADLQEEIEAHRRLRQAALERDGHFEGGTRVPFVVRWPAGVQSGVSDALVSQIDLLASFASWTGQTLEAADAPDSFAMMPVFLGQSKVGRPHVVEQAGGLALRMDRWKFMEPSKRPKMNVNTNTELGNDTVPQLYNLADDPGETRNVAAQHPARVREMTTLLGMIRKGATRTSLP